MIIDNNNVATEASSILSVPEDMFFFTIEELQIVGNAKVSYRPRAPSEARLTSQVGKLVGDKASSFNISNKVDLYLGTKASPPVTKLILETTVYVTPDASIELPVTVLVENDGVLDMVGTFTGVVDMTARSNGVIRLGYPVKKGSTKSVVEFNSLRIDYQGELQQSIQSTDASQKVELRLAKLYVVSESDVNTNYFTRGSNMQQVMLYTSHPAMAYTCVGDNENKLVIYRTQFCYLPTGHHSFSSIVIESGGELRLEGNTTGAGSTTIAADSLSIFPGGKLTGNGVGFISNGPGAGTTSGEGGSHGGFGGNVDVVSRLYGDILNPRAYGSNGFGASSSSGRGGGQLELVVSGRFPSILLLSHKTCQD